MIKLLILSVSVTFWVWGNVVGANASAQRITTECVNCHDEEGTNNAVLAPNLAGQNSLYLIKQIKAFNSGLRSHPILSSDNDKLNHGEVAKLADYYANLIPKMAVTKLNKKVDAIYGSCSACHGSHGEGIAPFPRLNGQTSAYIEQQLINFKSGVRKNSVMQTMSINLSDEEIKMLAKYLGYRKGSSESMSSENIEFDVKQERE